MLEEMKSWSSIALNLIALAGVIKLWINQGEKSLEKDVTSITERISKAEAKLIEYDRRIQTVEGDMRHMPDRDTAHKLELALAQISGRLDSMDAQIEGRMTAMDERLKPIAATSERLHELLMEQAKR